MIHQPQYHGGQACWAEQRLQASYQVTDGYDSSSYLVTSNYWGCPSTPVPQSTDSSRGSELPGASTFRTCPVVRWGSSRLGGATVERRGRRRLEVGKAAGWSGHWASEAERADRCRWAVCQAGGRSTTAGSGMSGYQCPVATRLQEQPIMTVLFTVSK